MSICHTQGKIAIKRYHPGWTYQNEECNFWELKCSIKQSIELYFQLHSSHPCDWWRFLVESTQVMAFIMETSSSRWENLHRPFHGLISKTNLNQWKNIFPNSKHWSETTVSELSLRLRHDLMLINKVQHHAFSKGKRKEIAW